MFCFDSFSCDRRASHDQLTTPQTLSLATEYHNKQTTAIKMVLFLSKVNTHEDVPIAFLILFKVLLLHGTQREKVYPFIYIYKQGCSLHMSMSTLSF